MTKRTISLVSRWQETGALSPFRDLAFQLVQNNNDFSLPVGYESLLQRLLQSENGSGKFVPAQDDPCLPNRETTNRIADGVVNLLTELLQIGYVFKIRVYDKSFDPWTAYCLENLQKRGFSSSLEFQFLQKTLNGKVLLSEKELRANITSAIRFGFTWDVPNILLRSLPVRVRDCQAAHNFLGHTMLAYRKFPAAKKHFEIAQRGDDPHMRACAKFGNVYCAVRSTVKQNELLRFIQGIADDIEKIPDISVKKRLQVFLPNLQAFILKKSEPYRALNLLEIAISQAGEYNLPLHLAVFLKNNAVLLQKIGRSFCEVVSLFEHTISYRPFDPDWYCELGQIYLNQNDIISASKYFQAAYEPGFPQLNTLLGLAQCASKIEKYHEEFKYRKAAVEMRPDISDLYIGLGRSSLKTASPKESIQIFLQAWHLDPEQETPAYELFRLLIQKDIPDISCYSDVILDILSRRKQALSAKLNLLLGHFFLRGNRRKLAQHYLLQATMSEDLQILFVSNFYLGNLMVDFGDIQKARSFYDRCLELQPGSKEIITARTKLEIFHTLDLSSS